ncbi:MarR family transcriptional regulator [Gammaproteobacteria bacterium]|nr:MarR family transcriptional regulator [Gammaproteobacteria bacterium]
MNSKTRSGMDLDDQLCFALYRATQAVTASYRNHLAGVGLTYTQFLVLLVLWELEDVSVGQISNRLGLDSGTLTPLLKRLEQRELITRKREREDERVVRICLTETGRNLRDPVNNARKKVGADTGMTPKEVDRLREELHRLSNQIENLKKT